MNKKENRVVQLESGNMQLSMRSASSWNADALFAMAERRNPRRAFLFVSKVLGRHIPCAPYLMRQAFSDLALQIPVGLPGPVLITGMAETAIGLTCGVHQVYASQRDDCVLLTTTRHPLGGALLCRFEEEHSHATAHLVHLPEDSDLLAMVLQARTVIMVDDEATTGKTFLNLFNALQSAGLDCIEKVVTATLTDWSDGQVGKQLGHDIISASLAFGRWQWTPAANPPLFDAPSVNVTAKGTQQLNTLATIWGRCGALHHSCLLQAKPVVHGEKILVLGSGEYVWQPFLLAESLQAAGAEVKFSATTRSPVAVGHAIQCSMSFNDNYGLGLPMYLYNVVPEHYDRVILCSETPASSWDSNFLSRFSKIEIVDGSYHHAN